MRIHPDHLNTPRLIADATGTPVWKWDQVEPFGVNTPDENPSALGAFEFPLRFPGQYADKETTLSYNFFRDYDSAIGGYKQSDPIGVFGGVNTYAYTYGSPLRFADPRGLVVQGTWVKNPTVADPTINLVAIEPTLGWKWLPPTIKLINVQLEGIGRIEYEIRCTDDKNMCSPSVEEWTLKGSRAFATPNVKVGLGPTVIPHLGLNLALSTLGGVIEYGQAIASINSYFAAEIARLTSNPTTYCLAFPKGNR